MRESRFVIQKRIRIRSLDARDTGRRTEGARERTAQAVGHMGWPWLRPWAPRPGAPSAPVWATRPPRPGGDVAPRDWPKNLFSLLLFLPSLSHFEFPRRKIKFSRQPSPLNFQIFETPYLPHPESDLSDSSWRVFVFESSNISKWFGGCWIVISSGWTLNFAPAAESEV